MKPSLAQILDDRFVTLLGRGTLRARAAYLGTDPGTYSKIVGGALLLTRDRALKWAHKLFPDDNEKADEFAESLLGAEHPVRPKTVDQVCQAIVAAGGAVPAERIADLFEALQHTQNPLVCVEYRDPPRAGKSAKYEGLGEVLGRAIKNGLNFVMFQPFGRHIIFPPDPDSGSPLPEGGAQSVVAAAYTRQVRDKCREAYRAFKNYAGKDAEGSLRLYERDNDVACLGSGFQAKLFYVQYSVIENDLVERHQRILQWVSTPKQDLLIYRGENHINPEAIRDTFFPIVHYFESTGGLPSEISEQTATAAEHVGPESRPYKYNVWKLFDE